MLPSMTSLSTSTTVPLDLRFIADALARPPFNMQHTVIALHDEMEHPELVALINDVLSHIDASNPISPHKIDLRNELPAVTAQRMSEFLINALKFDFALHTAATLSQKIVSGDDRTLMLQILYFLLKDIEAHKKAAYLDRFCGIMQIPVEFSVDESIQELLQQLKDRQDDFSQLVQRADQLQLSSKQTIDLKRDIHQMEEEKQQINGKIQQLQRKVQEIPNSSKWLQAARDLRQEQQKAQKLQQQTQELQSQLLAAQEKFETLEKSVQVTQGLPKFDPQALMIQLKEEVESKKNSVEVTLPEQIHAVEKELQTLEKALHEPHYSNSELVKLEQDVEALAEQLKSIQDRRNAKSETQDKLALYRQQLTVVKGKKSNLVQRTEQLTQSLETKSQTIEAKKKELASATSSTSQSMPLRGEEFKQYIAELRVKSQQYKQAKAEMQTIQRESQVLERTLELLMQKKEQLQRSNSEKEQRQGVSGYVEKKQKLANLSEAKGSLEDTNEEGVHEFTALVKALTDEIHAQQHQLAPAIQELKALRAKNAELEAKYIAAKKEFEAEVVGLEKMVMDLQQEAQQEMETLASETSLWHTHMASMQILDTTMDHVLQEMKAVTDKSTSDSIQRQCGFKTWQDFLQRKCLEAEAAAKQLQIQHKKVEELQSPNEKQLVLFQALHKVLQMRLEMNQKYINEPKEPKNAEELLSPTEQRLVIS